MKRPFERLLLSVLLGGALLLSTASATTYRALSLAEMVERAEIAVHATVETVVVEEREGEPWTVVQFDILEDLAGERDEPLVLAFYGGSLPQGTTVLVADMPQFAVGEEVVLLAFDAAYYSPIVGFSQGLWRLTPRGLEDQTGRILSLGEEGELLQEGTGGDTEAIIAGLKVLLEGQ